MGGDIAILGRVAAQFAVSETTPPGMTLLVAAGAAFRSGSVIEVPARVTATIVTPAGNPRIDRVVINMTTDALVVVQGAEASVPTAPLVPAGHLTLARVALTPGMTAITNTAITDERLNGGAAATQGGGSVGVQTFTTNGHLYADARHEQDHRPGCWRRR